MPSRPDERRAVEDKYREHFGKEVLPTTRMYIELYRAQERLPVRPVSEGDKVHSLEARLSRDVEVVRRSGIMSPEQWNNATSAERLLMLANLERSLARSQGREARRVYACELNSTAAKNSYAVAAITDSVSPERSLQEGYAAGLYIRIDQTWLKDSPAGIPPSFREVALMFFEESRHAYQASAMMHPNRHPEVAASVRETWYGGHESYEKDEMDEGKYHANPLEVDAKHYASRMVQELFGG